MPYSNNQQLPKAQTDQYDEHQKSVFRGAFNSCYHSGKPESNCFAIAHAAAQSSRRAHDHA
jgi:cation transport regulator ChaB